LIELLLQAERALSVGLLDQAERLYTQAFEADPRNSIAVVGLARVALERGDDRRSYVLAQQALAIDPENQAARRMVERLAEVMRHRGETPPANGTGETGERGDAQPVPPAASEPQAPVANGSGRGLLRRLLRRDE
jgi:thioredoxin-like negative regulator of GroEL